MKDIRNDTDRLFALLGVVWFFGYNVQNIHDTIDGILFMVGACLISYALGRFPDR